MKKDNSEAHNFVFEMGIITVSPFAQGVPMRPGESEGCGENINTLSGSCLLEVARAGWWSHGICYQATFRQARRRLLQSCLMDLGCNCCREWRAGHQRETLLYRDSWSKGSLASGMMS